MSLAPQLPASTLVFVTSVTGLPVAKRGELVAWNRECTAALQATYEEMKRFCLTVNEMKARAAYVILHQRSPVISGQMVRWRSYQHRHIKWVDVQPMLKDSPRQVIEWYVEVNKQMEMLNLQERTQRAFVKVTVNALEVIDAARVDLKTQLRR
jgi:hypothetical protein